MPVTNGIGDIVFRREALARRIYADDDEYP